VSSFCARGMQTWTCSCSCIEAFDESWKADETGIETEAHWGLFRADRGKKTPDPAACER